MTDMIEFLAGFGSGAAITLVILMLLARRPLTEKEMRQIIDALAEKLGRDSK